MKNLSFLVFAFLFYSNKIQAKQVALLSSYSWAECDGEKIEVPRRQTLTVNRVGHGEYDFKFSTGNRILSYECNEITFHSASKQEIDLPADILNTQLLARLDSQSLVWLALNYPGLGKCYVDFSNLQILDLTGDEDILIQNYKDAKSMITSLRAKLSSGACEYPFFEGLSAQKTFWLNADKELLSDAKEWTESFTKSGNNLCDSELKSYQYFYPLAGIWAELVGITLDPHQKFCTRIRMSDGYMNLRNQDIPTSTLQYFVTNGVLTNDQIIKSLVASFSSKNSNYMFTMPAQYWTFLQADESLEIEFFTLMCNGKKECLETLLIDNGQSQLWGRKGNFSYSFFNRLVPDNNFASLIYNKKFSAIEAYESGVPLKKILEKVQAEISKEEKKRRENYYSSSLPAIRSISEIFSEFSSHPEILLKEKVDLQSANDILKDKAQVKEMAMVYAKNHDLRVNDIIKYGGMELSVLYRDFHYTAGELFTADVSPYQLAEMLADEMGHLESGKILKGIGIDAYFLHCKLNETNKFSRKELKSLGFNSSEIKSCRRH